jgi:hypothetical protein
MAFVNKADGNNTDIDNLICTVNRSTKKVFLFSVYVMPDMRDQIGGGFNADSLRADAAGGILQTVDRMKGFFQFLNIRVIEAIEIMLDGLLD